MWIIPKNLHTSAFVPDTAALISDSSEQSALFAQSLLVRSNPLPARTWSRKWNRDSWTAHLSGRTLKPSHGPDFEERWTSCLEASLVNHLVPQDSAPEMRTQDTCSLTSSEESESWSDLPLFSLRMSKASSTQNSKATIGTTPKVHRFCSMSLESWNDWVTAQRLEFSQRLKSVRLTKESASLSLAFVQTLGGEDAKSSTTSWGTPRVGAANGPGGGGNPQSKEYHYRLENQVQMEKTWPTPRALEVQESVEQHTTRAQKVSAKNRGPSLSVAVQMPWPTPTTQEIPHPHMTLTPTGRRAAISVGGSSRGLNLYDAAILAEQENQVSLQHYSLPAEERHSTDGNHLESPQENKAKQWGTPTARDYKDAALTRERLPMKDGTRRLSQLPQQVLNLEGYQGALNPRWVETLMGIPVGWTMPACASPSSPAQMSCGCLETELYPQLLNERSGSCGSDWTTPTARDYADASMMRQAPDRADGKTRLDLMPRQVHHETGYTGALNPRWVETLMGLPVGWTLPSCGEPVMPVLMECGNATVSQMSDQTDGSIDDSDCDSDDDSDDDALEQPSEPAKGKPMMWKTPRACEGEGGVKRITEGVSTNYKLRDQVHHQGSLNYFPKPHARRSATEE